MPFLKTKRLVLGLWKEEDLFLAERLWSDPLVCRYISAKGYFTREEIVQRLQTEMQDQERFSVQYWPLFLHTGEFVGCCGLHPRQEKEYELGFHLLPEYWGKEYAYEASEAVISYAFAILGAEKLFAGHHPENRRSERVLAKLGFTLIGSEYYAPTGLMHPSYELRKETV